MTHSGRRERCRRLALALLVSLLWSAWAAGADPPKTRFQLPEGDAAVTLRQFSQQARTPIVYPVDAVRGVKTNPVQGEFTARAALDRMVAGTALFVSQDAATGALTVGRVARPPAPVPRSVSPPDPPSAPPVSPSSMTSKPTSLFTAILAALAAPGLAAQPVAGTPAKDETIALAAFTVTADQERGYLAGNAISGTRTNTALRDLPISISVITSDMLADLATTLPSDALLYSASVDLTNGGTIGNIQGSPFNTGTTNVRGSGTFFVMRDGFRSYGEPAGAGVQRIEVIKGPAAVLYGITKPGGIINYLTKVPVFGKTAARGSFAYGSYGSARSTLDLNYGSLLGGKLAVGLNASYHDLSTWFRFSQSREFAVLPSVSYRPFRGTEIMLQYEYTERNLPPNSTDYFTRPVPGFRGSSVPFFVAPSGAGDPVANLAPAQVPGLGPDFTFRGYGSKTRVPYKTLILSLNQQVGEHLAFNLQASRSRRNNWRQSFTPTVQFTGAATDAAAGNPVAGTAIIAAPRIRKQFEVRDAFNEIDNVNFTAIYRRTVRLPLVGPVANKLILGLAQMVDQFDEHRAQQFVAGTATRVNYYYPLSATTFTGLPDTFPRDLVGLPRPAPGQALAVAGLPGDFRVSAADNAVEDNQFRTAYLSWAGTLAEDRVILNAGLVRALARQDRWAGAANAYSLAQYAQNSPLVGAVVRPLPWASLYVQTSKSFNPNTSARDGFDTPLPAEQGKGRELGLKLDPWGGRLTANFAVYRTVETNRFITDPNAPNRNSFYLDAAGRPQPLSGPDDPRYDPNTPGQQKGAGAAVGEATTDGFEAEFVWSPVRQFQVLAGYSYLDGYVSRDTNTALATAAGRPLPSNYYHRATALAKYQFDRGALKGFDVALGTHWRSAVFRDLVNATVDATNVIVSPVRRFGKPSLDGDFKIGYRTKILDRRTSFQLNVKNLYGRDVGVGWQPTTARSYAFEQYYYTIPRSYQVSVGFEL